MITIVDYDAGNIRSVACALKRLGAEYELSDDPARIAGADKLILPGVGSACRAMESLREKGLCDAIRSRRKPVLGICVGMQIMCADSTEGVGAQCLSIFDAHVDRLSTDTGEKVPNMGWCRIANTESKLFAGLEKNPYLYFVHSYAASLGTDTIATVVHGGRLYSAALKWEQFYGTQFHPEKSGSAGEQILKNFLAL